MIQEDCFVVSTPRNDLKMKKIFFFLLLLLPFSSHAVPQDAALRAVSLLDYLQGDYQMAVAAEGGKIINQDEYAEMQDFADLVSNYLDALMLTSDDSLKKQSFQLNMAVKDKIAAKNVARLCADMKTELIRRFKIPTHPSTLPDLARGKELYLQSCATCHGEDGAAQTLVAKQLNPKPVAFRDPETLDKLSPFKAFNTITYGVSDTPMPSFIMLSDGDRWALAAFVFTLRGAAIDRENSIPEIPWQEAMALSDGQINEKLRAQGLEDLEINNNLYAIRHQQVEDSAAKKSSTDGQSALAGLQTALLLIQQSLEQVKNGNYQEALDGAVTAYLDGFEASEALLKSVGQEALVSQIEQLFLTYRNDLRQETPAASQTGSQLLTTLAAAEKILQDQGALSPTVSFIAAFTIIFREGLEAILLLAIILSALHAIKRHELVRWVHMSWVMALVAGFFTWLAARHIISGVAREGMEGWVSLLAAVVLLYVSYWLFAKRDAERWKQMLMGKIRDKKTLGLVTICLVSFLAVYREVFESILFLEALQLQQAGVRALSMGGIVAGALLMGSAWLIIRVGKKLPLNILFGWSSLLLCFLAIVFVGQGIHGLQEADFISQTPIHFFTIPILGIYPFFESVGIQAASLGLILVGLVVQQWIKKSPVEAKIAETSTELFNVHDLGEHLMEHLNHLKNKLGHKDFPNREEIKEIMGHMHDLDFGIHRVILMLKEIHAELPKRFDEVFAEVENLADSEHHQALVNKAEDFKKHLEMLQKKEK